MTSRAGRVPEKVDRAGWREVALLARDVDAAAAILRRDPDHRHSPREAGLLERAAAALRSGAVEAYALDGVADSIRRFRSDHRQRAVPLSRDAELASREEESAGLILAVIDLVRRSGRDV